MAVKFGDWERISAWKRSAFYDFGTCILTHWSYSLVTCIINLVYSHIPPQSYSSIFRMILISFKKLFELTADIPAGQMADAFKKWVANIASQYCLFVSYQAAECLPLASTIAKLENILNRQEKIRAHITLFQNSTKHHHSKSSTRNQPMISQPTSTKKMNPLLFLPRQNHSAQQSDT